MQQLTKDLKQFQQYYFKKPISEKSVKILNKGHSAARNYRIDDGSNIYLARHMPMLDPLPYREKECLITDYAGKIGIGPKIYYQNAQQGILITEFIEGRTANHADMVGNSNRNLIIDLVKQLHQNGKADLPKAATITARIKHLLISANLTIFQQQLHALKLTEPLRLLFHYEALNHIPTLIHGDLIPTNIIVTNHRVYLIDWTDGGMGDAFIDIARHAILFPLAAHDDLLRYYFARPTPMLQQKLLGYYCLNLFLRAVWSVAHAKQISIDAEHLLIATLQQSNLPDPVSLMTAIYTNKITIENPNNLLLYSAVMLHFLTKFTKTDAFLAAIGNLSHHA